MAKVIILEGPDNLGKTTVAKCLASKLPGQVIIDPQPNPNNCLGFVRGLVKNPDFKIDPFARQLLHTLSHTVDAYSVKQAMDFVSYVIFDRCYVSSMVYAKATGCPDEAVDLLYRLHWAVYRQLKWEFSYYIQFDAEKPFAEVDSSYYEKYVKWVKIRDCYREIWRYLEDKPVFLEDKEVQLLHKISNQTTDEVCDYILDLVL